MSAILALLVLTAAGTVLAQNDTAVTRGLAWLQAQVQPAGSIANENASAATATQVRTEVGQTLKGLATMPAGLAGNLAADVDDNTEYLARRLIVQADSGSDAAPLVAALLARQNQDGSFANAPGYAGSALDTSWALLALQAAKQSRHGRASARPGLPVGGAAGGRGLWPD
ncbi:hypothetical protein ACHMW6_21220 [Pseudoduganella sp. UC29_106]|uniref:hypothetical protein n=1 Tax=Pseudoduganella sp. UC29_106 TaxID=3374553 RepID=UPI0037577710